MHPLRLALAAALLTPATYAAMIYSQNFDSLSTGSLIGQDGYGQDIGANTAYQVVTNVGVGGTQALQWNPSGEVNFSRAVRFLSSSPYADIVISMDFFVSLTGTLSEYRLSVFNPSFVNILSAQLRSDGQIGILNGTGTAPFTRGVWNQLILESNNIDGTAKLYMNGDFISSRSILTGTNGSMGAFSFTMNPNGVGTATLYSDNFAIEGVPEPSTYLLTGIGLLVAIQHHRRQVQPLATRYWRAIPRKWIKTTPK